MGQSSRRRKGKSGSRSSTPTPSAEIEALAEGEEKQESPVEPMEESKDDAAIDEDALLVLTSEKRRGVYECDYCHSDISQQPRIRCAVCNDFDLCLDCFATSDHEAMIARIKATTQTQTELTKDGIGSTAIVVSSAAANHEADHKYRVCDSTRYPMFPAGRVAPPATEDEAEAEAPVPSSFYTNISDDPKTMWTAEEDLRLIDAIGTHGLGNWQDISEAIGGHGSVGKTPKRCMERYLDDFLGRYGHILPQYTIVDDTVEESVPSTSETSSNDDKDSNTETKDDKDDKEGTEGSASDEQSDKKEGDEKPSADTSSPVSTENVAAPSTPAVEKVIEEEEVTRTSKRRSSAIASGSSLMGGGRSSSRKKLKVVTTESLPGYDAVWPKPYLPEIENVVPGKEVVMGKEVARDQSCKAELAFVKSTLAAPSKTEADKIRKTWVETRLGKVGSPTVLPPRPQDAVHLLGSELAGFMPRRGDFDVEWENDAETGIADMEFIRGDTPEDKELKLKVLQIYCEKLDERQKRKKFVLERHLYDYRKYVQDDTLLPMDERDLVHRMRLFERFHTPEEHKKFIVDILKAKRLRKEIAKLQMYRRIGIKSQAEAEKYELDKDRRLFHKKLETDAKAKGAAAIASAKAGAKGTTSSELATGPTRTPIQMKTTDSLWKQYRTNDRKNRRNSVKSENSTEEPTEKSIVETIDPKGDETKEGEKKEDGEKTEVKETETTESEAKESTDENAMDVEKKDEDEAMADAETDDVANKEDDKEDESKESEEKPSKEEFDMTGAPCRELLSRKELALCERHEIYPVQYLEIKKVLIHEALTNGLLDKDTSTSSKRTIVKIDVERRGNVVDFLVRAGWICRKLGDVAMRVVTPQPTTTNDNEETTNDNEESTTDDNGESTEVAGTMEVVETQ